MRNPAERLRGILEAIAAIERHQDSDKAAFERDELLQARFLRHLQIIGEAARALPMEVRTLAPARWRTQAGRPILGPSWNCMPGQGSQNSGLWT